MSVSQGSSLTMVEATVIGITTRAAWGQNPQNILIVDRKAETGYRGRVDSKRATLTALDRVTVIGEPPGQTAISVSAPGAAPTG